MPRSLEDALRDDECCDIEDDVFPQTHSDIASCERCDDDKIDEKL